MDIEQEVQRFRMDMLRKMPFYGDIVIRLPFSANPGCRTACTNGRSIEYNPDFLRSLSAGERNYVLMHEVFHVLLHHCRRSRDKDPRLWNTAADLMVNSMLDQLQRNLLQRGIAFQRPKESLTGYVGATDTVENLYESLRLSNREEVLKKGLVNYTGLDRWKRVIMVGKLPEDLKYPGTAAEKTGDEKTEGEESNINGLIREALEKARGEIGSFYLPQEFLKATESRRLDWKSLLRSFLTEELSEESSYITPERKYIHMDLILPGYSREETRIEEIWAFVDSSGSIGRGELEEFLTQLSRIAREFKCVFHIAYWDTQVTEVYRKVRDEKKIWECMPRHSGGTDINCVYRWLRQERLRPAVMLILTDGYFGLLNDSFIPSLKSNTILVLSGTVLENEDMRRIGKIARLE